MSRKPPRFDGFFDDAVKHIPLDNEVPIQERLLDDKRIRDGEEFFEVTTIPWDELDIRSLGKPQFEDEPWGTELNPDDRRLLDGACRKIGFEIIAFYKSKRQESRGLFPGTWGIYYFKQGLKRVQEQINTVFPSRSTESAALAYKFVRAHERFHYKFDVLALTVESASKKSLYNPLKLYFRQFPHYQIEEALANQDAFRWAKHKTNDLEKFATGFMGIQPGSYRRYGEPRVELLAELAANLIDHRIINDPRRYDQVVWNGKLGVYGPTAFNPPEHLLIASSISSLIPSSWALPKISQIVETLQFEKSLRKKHEIQRKWNQTKKKLLQEPGLNGLDFKEWPKDNCYSVKVGENYRAHINPLKKQDYSGIWEALKIDNHKAMGHG